MSNVRGTPVAHTSPRGEFVFDMRKLSRQPGSLLEMARTVPAPAGLGAGLAVVPAGADVTLDVRFEAVTEGVLVTGTAIAPLDGECARCLDPVASTVEASLMELYSYEPDAGGEDADETRFLVGDKLDLEPAFRDAVVLALPLSPLCREDCPGLCAQCGVRLADAGPSHVHDEADSRWNTLRGLDLNDEVSDSNNRQEG